MFSKITKISGAAFALLALLWLLHVCVPRESDYAARRALMEKSEIATTSSVVYASTHQTRQGVRKEIWFTQEDGQRLHHRIESRASVLMLEPNEHHFDIVENLQGIKC